MIPENRDILVQMVDKSRQPPNDSFFRIAISFEWHRHLFSWDSNALKNRLLGRNHFYQMTHSFLFGTQNT
jgi:hypothetical protein